MKRIVIFFVCFFSMSFAFAEANLPRAVGQMMMVGFVGTSVNAKSPIVEVIKKYHVGGIILFDHLEKKKGKHWIPRNVNNPEQVKKLISQLQKFAKQYQDYPLLIAINQEGGDINALTREKGFDLDGNWSQAELGKSGDQSLIYQQALFRGKLLQYLGVNVDLAPVADLNINPKNPGIGLLERSFGHDAGNVAVDLATTISAYHAAKIHCTLKHFPGFGSASQNTDYAVANVSASWRETELIPYHRLIQENKACSFIMSTHAINRQLDASGVPMTFSRKVISNLLRDQLHFQGVVITDDMDAKAVRQLFKPEKAIRLAVLAGNDMILYGGTFGHDPIQDANVLYHTLLTLATSDESLRKQIFLAYTRIQKVKSSMNVQGFKQVGWAEPRSPANSVSQSIFSTP